MSKTTTIEFESKEDISRDIHLLPCHFAEDATAPVSVYFKIQENSDNVKTSSFRGRPLLGNTINVPSGYEGALLESLESNDSTFNVTKTFKSLNYWNWDKLPSNDDKVVRAMDWFLVAEAIHKPVHPDILSNKSADNVSPKKTIKK